MNTELPEALTPLNLHAYFFNAFGACGCSELDEMYISVLNLLEWHAAKGDDKPKYDTLYNEVGVFYLLVGLLDNLGLTEHGTSIRWPFLNENGERLLKAMRQYSVDEVFQSEGEAYDGCHYGH